MGGLTKGKDSQAEKDLISVILLDLAAVHGIDVGFLQSQMVAHHAFDWYHDPYTQGAFALYGPSQFQDLFPGVTRPASKGFLHIAGEATSVHHAWIAGALASAWRTVAEILLNEGRWDLFEELERLWIKPDEIDIELLAKQVALGNILE